MAAILAAAAADDGKYGFCWLLLLFFPLPFDDDVMGGRDGPKETFTSVPPLPPDRLSAEFIRAELLPLPELLVFVLVVMLAVLFPPVGFVILTVCPLDSLLLLFAESLLFAFTVRARTFLFLPLFVALVVEPAMALSAIPRDDEEFYPLLLLPFVSVAFDPRNKLR